MAAAPGRDGRSRARDLLAALLFANPLYTASLNGRAPSGLRLLPEDPWPGDAEAAAGLLRGRYNFAGEEIVAPNLPPWAPYGVSEAWLTELHGFTWLRHLQADGSLPARHLAAGLVSHWLSHHPRWHPLIWRPDVLGRRLLSWLGHAEFLSAALPPPARAAFLDGLTRQTRHLSRSIGMAEPGAARLGAGIALVVGSLSLGISRRAAVRGLNAVEREIAAQILGDGGHASRNPSLHLSVLRDLIALRGVLLQGQEEVPQSIQSAIDRMSPMLRFFRHGDGGLALFQGSREEAEGMVDLTLSRAGARGKAPTSARQSGYERLAARRTLLLVDTGAPLPASSGYPVHAGLLSFELSIGRQRLVVNAGAPDRPSPAWSRAMRATAAHSTLTLADTNAAQLRDDGRLSGAPPAVGCERNESEGAVWLEAYHEGYREMFGLVHRRRLYLDPDGDEIRGEDTLIGPPRHATRFAIRFHLHPLVQASLVQNGVAALLKLTGGTGFRLIASSGSELALEESVYLGAGQMRRSEQVVIHGIAEGGETVVKWQFNRINVQRSGTQTDTRQGELH